MELNLDKNFIFLGNSEGTIVFYDFNDEDLNNITMNKRFKIKSELKFKVTKINYNISKNYLYVSFSNGSTAIYAHDEAFPECILIYKCLVLLEGHVCEVNNTYWDDDQKILLTSGSDMRFKVLILYIKIWQLPVFYPSEIMRKNQDKNDLTFITVFF